MFPSSPGPLGVDLRCEGCDGPLPLPPAVGKWSNLDGSAPEGEVWSLSSAGTGAQRGHRNPYLPKGAKARRLVLHFSEGPYGRTWHWLCRCGATPAMYEARFEAWIGDVSQPFDRKAGGLSARLIPKSASLPR